MADDEKSQVDDESDPDSVDDEEADLPEGAEAVLDEADPAAQEAAAGAGDRIKSSRAFKAKKFWASKTAQTKLGRKVITHFLGQSANSLLDNLHNVAKRDAGKKTANQLNRIILKLALKAKLLHDEKLLVYKTIRPVIEPVNEMSTKLHEAFAYDVLPPQQLELLEAKFTQLRETMEAVVAPLMKDKNIAKLQQVLNYFGSRRVLGLLYNDENYAKEKAAIEVCIQTLVRPLLAEQEEDKARCGYPGGCPSSLVGPQGKFRGSTLCALHHLEMYENLLARPSVHHFLLEDGKTYKPKMLPDDLFPPYYGLFYAAVHNYQRSAPNIRTLFAESICEKYLEEKAPCQLTLVGKDALVQSALKTIANTPKNEKPEPTVFDDLQAHVLAELEAIFHAKVVPSNEYKTYLHSIELPKNVAKTAKQAREQLEKEAKKAGKKKS